jgi:hypothetical protein
LDQRLKRLGFERTELADRVGNLGDLIALDGRDDRGIEAVALGETVALLERDWAQIRAVRFLLTAAQVWRRFLFAGVLCGQRLVQPPGVSTSSEVRPKGSGCALTS